VKCLPLVAGLSLWLPTQSLADAAEGMTRPSNIFYLGDSYLDADNYFSLIHATTKAYAPPWSTIVNLALGLPAVGRWTSAGDQPPLGNDYAVAGAGINFSTLTAANTSLHGQIAKLLQDYPQGLPSGSLVVIGIGTNDVRNAVELGGIWSSASTDWRLDNAGFTVPEIDSSVTVSVTSTAGMTPGQLHFIAFPNDSKPAIMALTKVDPLEHKVTLTNKRGTPGTTISPNSGFQVCGKWFLEQELPILAADIESVAKHGASASNRGDVILVLLPPTDMLPEYNKQPTQFAAKQAWKYLYEKLRTLALQNPRWIRTFDLKPIFRDVFSHPKQYGFRFNHPGWLGSGSANPNEYMFQDLAHPSGSMHRLIAERFLEFLQVNGFTH
jgi:lysophospholipase L1-like esterase